MRIFAFTFLILGLIAVLSSCSYKQDQLLFQQKDKYDSLSRGPVVSLADYKIQPQDILQIRNLHNINYIKGDAPSATSATSGIAGNATDGQFQVEEDGTVALPVLGPTKVAGLTRIEVTKKIQDAYSKSLLIDPIIEVKIINLKVTILGEIRSQGNFPLVKDKTSLVELIGEAGGLTDRANEKNIEIIRGDPTHPIVKRIDLSNINSLADPAAILQNGDIIYVAQNNRAIRSDKVSTFSTIIQPALILLNTFLIIFTLARH